jgi:hypothetical protein
VDNVQRAFGLNLETTRTGFTRLYASMAPTGFDSGSIEKLFTGISAATASLQLTPDKAERVIYAFGQMASKGQIMAEELTGQLETSYLALWQSSPRPLECPSRNSARRWRTGNLLAIVLEKYLRK